MNRSSFPSLISKGGSKNETWDEEEENYEEKEERVLVPKEKTEEVVEVFVTGVSMSGGGGIGLESDDRSDQRDQEADPAPENSDS